MKHAITLTFAMVACSEPAQRSAFDPEASAQRQSQSIPSPAFEEDQTADAAEAVAFVPEAEPEPEVAGMDEPEVISDDAVDSEPVAEPMNLKTVTVRSGESLDRLSKWSDSSVEEIATVNQLEISAPLVPGQVLQIPIADQEAFDSSRDGALERRLERYLASNGGLAGIEGYTVRTGDTAWGIAKHIAGVPSWVLAAFNADRGLDHLSVGDTLYLPIMTQVADNEEPMDELNSDVLAAAPEGLIMD